jgi:trafficking protein particle complex subunit 2
MFLIIGKNDVPLYEASLGTVRRDIGHLNQFIIHAALDIVDEEAPLSSNMYLKTVDKFNDLYVSAYVTAANVRLMLVHDTKNEDGIKNFFIEVHENIVKAMMNPLFDVFRSFPPAFDSKVRAAAKKFLI